MKKPMIEKTMKDLAPDDFPEAQALASEIRGLMEAFVIGEDGGWQEPYGDDMATIVRSSTDEQVFELYQQAQFNLCNRELLNEWGKK